MIIKQILEFIGIHKCPFCKKRFFTGLMFVYCPKCDAEKKDVGFDKLPSAEYEIKKGWMRKFPAEEMTQEDYRKL